MMPGNKTVIQTWIIFQLFNVIPLSFLCLQFLHKGKHYTIACLSITIIFDCIISVPIALQYYFIDSNSISSTTPKNISTNDPIINNNTYSTNNTDMEFWNETSSTMSLVALDDNANLEPICIAQAYALFSIQLSMGFWIFCLMINMWLLLVKATSDIETKWFKFHIIFSWVVPLLITFTTFMLLKPQANFGVDTSYYYCIVTGGLIHLVANHAPFLLCMFIGLGLGIHASWALITYRTRLSKGRANKLKIPMGLCIRMILFCILFILLSTIKIVLPLEDLFESLNIDTSFCETMFRMIPHIDAYFNTILTYSLFLIFGTTKEALRTLLRCTCCFKNLFPKRSSIATFINNPNPKHNSTGNNTSMMANNGENDDDDYDIETDPESEMTMVEHPPSTFGNLKRTKSFSKYKIGDDVLKFEEAGWGNVFRNYSIGRNGRHNYGGKHKFDKSGGDNSASSVIHSAINSVKSLKSLKSLNRFLESQQNDKNGNEIKQNGGNEHTNDDNTVEKENKITISLMNNDQIISDTLPPTPPPPTIPSMHLKSPGSMRN